MFVLYKICHYPGLTVHIYHLSNIYSVYKNKFVYEFEMFEARPAYIWYIFKRLTSAVSHNFTQYVHKYTSLYK
jgi:hypothetical protein